MKKFKKGDKICTDYFAGPGEYEEFLIDTFGISGSIICLRLYDSRKNIILGGSRAYCMHFEIKKFNKLFFTNTCRFWRFCWNMGWNDTEEKIK